MVWASTYQECCNTVGIFAIVVVALVNQPAFERRTVSRRCCSSLRQPLQSLDSCVAGRTRFVKYAFLVDSSDGTPRPKRKHEKHKKNNTQQQQHTATTTTTTTTPNVFCTRPHINTIGEINVKISIASSYKIYPMYIYTRSAVQYNTLHGSAGQYR